MYLTRLHIPNAPKKLLNSSPGKEPPSFQKFTTPAAEVFPGTLWRLCGNSRGRGELLTTLFIHFASSCGPTIANVNTRHSMTSARARPDICGGCAHVPPRDKRMDVGHCSANALASR